MKKSFFLLLSDVPKKISLFSFDYHHEIMSIHFGGEWWEGGDVGLGERIF